MKAALIALVCITQAVKVAREPLLTWEATPPASHPINYPVPDFGVSHEILYTQNNIKMAEAEQNHVMTANFKADKNDLNPRNYPMYDFGIDHDILDSVANLKLEEGIHGEWVVPENAKAS